MRTQSHDRQISTKIETSPYLHQPDIFALHVRSFIDFIMTTEFSEHAGVRIKQRRYKSYLKMAPGLIGCPDVADIMEQDANAAKQILEQRFTDLLQWSERDLHDDEIRSKYVAETLSDWKKNAPQFQITSGRSNASLQLVN